MSEANKTILQNANAAVARGDIEGFLAFCADDIAWTAVGDMTITGKAALRAWMAKAYATPPKFTVTQLIADGDYLVAVGEIEGESDYGRVTHNAYSDVWRFRDGKMVELKAFVIEIGQP